MPTFSSDNDFARMIERYNQEMRQYIQSPIKNEVVETVAKTSTETVSTSEDAPLTESLTREIPYPLLDDEPNTQTNVEPPLPPPYPQDAIGFLQIQATQLLESWMASRCCIRPFSQMIADFRPC